MEKSQSSKSLITLLRDRVECFLGIPKANYISGIFHRASTSLVELLVDFDSAGRMPTPHRASVRCFDSMPLNLRRTMPGTMGGAPFEVVAASTNKDRVARIPEYSPKNFRPLMQQRIRLNCK